MPEVELDEHGHVRLAELELDRLLARQVKDRFRERGQNVTVEGKSIGYDLRCAPPIPFDIEYTCDLGYGAVDYLKRLLAEPGTAVAWRVISGPMALPGACARQHRKAYAPPGRRPVIRAPRSEWVGQGSGTSPEPAEPLVDQAAMPSDLLR